MPTGRDTERSVQIAALFEVSIPVELGRRLVTAKNSVHLPAGVTTTSMRERARVEDGDG